MWADACTLSDARSCLEQLHLWSQRESVASEVVVEAPSACLRKLHFLHARLLLAHGRLQFAASEAKAAQQLTASAQRAAADELLARVRAASRHAADAQLAAVTKAHADAWRAATEALHLAPLCPQLRLLRAGAAAELGLSWQCCADARAVLRTDAANGPAWALLARCLARAHPTRAGAALAQRALDACLRGAGSEALPCAHAAERNRRLLSAWASADVAAARGDVVDTAAALHGVLALSRPPHAGCECEALTRLCSLHALAARTSAHAHDVAGNVSMTLRWCSSEMAAREATLSSGDSTEDAVADALCAMHRAWARLLGGDAAAASLDAAAARRRLSEAAERGEEEEVSGEGGGEASSAQSQLRELDAAIARAQEPPDHYALLNVSRAEADALPEAVWREGLRRAYRKAALRWHPDKRHDDPQAAAAAFLLLAEAYRVLADPALRREYDRRLFGGGGGGDGDGDVGGPPPAREAVIAPGGTAGEEWSFHFDRRDVGADGWVEGQWRCARDGARRRGRRSVPPPGGAAAPEPCARGGARRGRCLTGRGGQPPPAGPPAGSTRPLSPPPTTQRGGRGGCLASARHVTNHFGLHCLALHFSQAAPPDQPAQPCGRTTGPRASPALTHHTRARADDHHAGCQLAWAPPGLRQLRARAGDVLVYELKWLTAHPEDGEPPDEELSDPGMLQGLQVPLSLVSLDLRWPGGDTLSSLGALDQHGLAAAPRSDLRAAMAQHGTAGWLERHVRLPRGGTPEALLLSCAAQPGMRVSAVLRHVRLLAQDGTLRAMLLDGGETDSGTTH